MQKIISLRQWKISGILNVLGILLIYWVTGTAVGAEQHRMQIGFNELGKVVLNIQTTHAPKCSLFAIESQIYRLQIRETGDIRIRKSASPLWQFFPMQVLQETNGEHTYSMDFKISADDNYGIEQHTRPSGISILFDGELAHKTWQQAITYGSRQYSALTPEEQQVLVASLDSIPSSPRDPFLLGVLHQARLNREFAWYDKVYFKVNHRRPLTAPELENLAQYFESIGDIHSAGIEWYEYYQRVATSGSLQYTDNLPRGSRIVREGTNPVVSGQGFHARAQAWWWIILIPFLSVVGAGGVWWYLRVYRAGKSKSEEVGHSPETVEFQSFLDEISEKLREEQPVLSRLEKTEPPAEHMEETSEPLKLTKEEQDHQTRHDRIRQKLQRYPEQQQMNEILPKQSKVYKLSKMEMAPDLIAKKLNMSRGEVELLLKIGNQNENDGNGSFRKERMIGEQFADASVR